MVALSSVVNSGNVFEVWPRWAENNALLLNALYRCGLRLWYASWKLKRSMSLDIAAVCQNGRSLKCADARLKGMRLLALVVISQDDFALKSVSAR